MATHRGAKGLAGGLFFLGLAALASVLFQVTQDSPDELLVQAQDAEFLSFGPRGPAPHQVERSPGDPSSELAAGMPAPSRGGGSAVDSEAESDGSAETSSGGSPATPTTSRTGSPTNESEDKANFDAAPRDEFDEQHRDSAMPADERGIARPEPAEAGASGAPNGPSAASDTASDAGRATDGRGTDGGSVTQGARLGARDAPPSPVLNAAQRSDTTDGRSVTWAFAGDTNFEGHLGTLLAKDPSLVLEPVGHLLGTADLTVVNLETAVSDVPGSATAKQFVFKAPTTAFEALAAAGVDAVTMANNHGLDYGRDGLADALAAADRAGVEVVGIGRDEAEAFAPAEFVIDGERVALFGATDVMDGPLISAWRAGPDRSGLAMAKGTDLDVLAGEIRRVRPDVDTVVVYLHWGVERATCPTERQVFVADTLVAAGADVVIGSHAHRLQAAGWRSDGSFIGYGLGNFAFASAGGDGAQSGVLRLETDDRAVVAAAWLPALIRSGQPIPLAADNADAAFSHWRSLLACTDLTHDPR